MSAVRQLRETLELRFPDAMPIARGLAPAVATGVATLDRALPNGGLPRGCLTVWRGGAGAAALLRSACAQAVARGERAAWVDGAGTTLGDFWPRGVLMVRPARRSGAAGRGAGETAARGRGRARARGIGSGLDSVLDTSLNTRPVALRALAAAEELLRSGGFALVVVTGVPRGLEAELVRLSRVAREGGGAVVAVEEGSGAGERGPGAGAGAVSAARLRVETRHRVEGHEWRRGVFGEPVELVSVGVEARVTGTGWLRSVNLQLPVVDHAYRLSLDPGLVDRRGVRGSRAGPVIDERRAGAAAERRSAEHSVDAGRPVVEQVVQSLGAGVQSAGGGGLAGTGEAGGDAAGGGAAAADRGARPDLGGRAWAGRTPLRRAAARVPRRSRVG